MQTNEETILANTPGWMTLVGTVVNCRLPISGHKNSLWGETKPRVARNVSRSRLETLDSGESQFRETYYKLLRRLWKGKVLERESWSRPKQTSIPGLPWFLEYEEEKSECLLPWHSSESRFTEDAFYVAKLLIPILGSLSYYVQFKMFGKNRRYKYKFKNETDLILIKQGTV